MTPVTASLLLLLLLACSAFFSASETALFSLRREDQAWLEKAGTAAARAALALLREPRDLLVAVLFGNLLVNFLLFSISAHLLDRLVAGSAVGLFLGGLVATAVVIVLGEITPKSIAVTVPRRVTLLTARPLLLFRDATRGLTAPLRRLVVGVLDLVERRLPPPQGPLSDQELRRFVELQGQEGLLDLQSSQFLTDVLELRSRRVHEVMTPRVDLAAFDLGRGREELLALVRAQRVGKIPVHRGGGPDTIHGYIRTRDLLRDPGAPLERHVRPIWFVPATKSLESLLREMIERDEPLALVVGEYGGTAGLVTLEDVVEEITGDIAHEKAPPLVTPAADDSWTMAGRLALREAGELLGLAFPVGATTLSGFLAQALGRIPEVGDVVWHGGIQFRVEAVGHRRATRVRVALPRPGRRGGAASQPPGEEITTSGAHRAAERLQRWVAESGGDSGDPERPPRPREDRP